jgi:hypothetical protein
MAPKLPDSANRLAKLAWESILTPHDNGPRSDSRLAIGAATRLWRSRGSTNSGWTGSDADRQREVAELRKAQIHLQLSDTCKASGGGGEHLVYRAKPHDGWLYKATWREGFGFIPGRDESGKWRLLPATPSDYLLRCGIANVVFGDHIRLLCIAQDQTGSYSVPSILTSQPYVLGEPSTPEEICAALMRQGFEPLLKATHRASGLHDTWCRRADHVVICDAVSGNFVTTPDGDVLPIDLPAAFVAKL